MKPAALALSLSVFLAGIASAGTTAPPSTPSDMWAEFLGRARFEQINESYQVLGRVGYGDDGVDAEGCAEHRAELDASIATVPVGIALRHAAMLCAEALGDAAAAERQMQVLAALSRHARDGAGTPAWTPPVRVVRPEDVEAFARAAGYTIRYQYYTELHTDRHFPLVVALHDSESGTERHVAFDWVDTLASLRSEREYHGFPFDRHLIAEMYVESWAGDGDVAAVDARGVRSAWMEPDPRVRRDLLQAAAGRGGMIAAQAWSELCKQNPFEGCADGLVDAVLPHAEKGHAAATMVLALAHLQAAGVPRDEDAAERMLDRADRAWDGQGATTTVAAMMLKRGDAWPAWLESRLQAAAAAGHPGPRALLIGRGSPDLAGLAAADRAFLESDETNRSGRGLELLVGLNGSAEGPEADRLIERAAQAGSAVARRVQATRTLERTPDDPAALAMLRDAAIDGDLPAAMVLAYRAIIGNRWKEAEGWLLGGTVRGDVTSILALAGLYAEGVEGLHSGPEDAVGTYEALAEESAEARRRLAGMLMAGKGTGVDLKRARQLLERDANAGDVESQLVLAGALRHGQLGPKDGRAGMRWLEKAVASGNADAKSDYGLVLHATAQTSKQRAEALRYLREADAGGGSSATNNLAWLLCVSPHADVLDPRAGLEVAARMGSPSMLDSGHIDTVAACHAAAGQFDEAVRLQGLALAGLPSIESYASTREGMQARLELYRSAKPYVEVDSPAAD